MRVKRITPAGRADVYNMEVEGTHDFVVQGGVVVHNCADESRYFCMARPIKPRVNVKAEPVLPADYEIALDIKPGDLPSAKAYQGVQIIG